MFEINLLLFKYWMVLDSPPPYTMPQGTVVLSSYHDCRPEFQGRFCKCVSRVNLQSDIPQTMTQTTL